MTKGLTNIPLRKKLVAEYLEMENPPPLKPWLRKHHFIKQTFDTIKGELKVENKLRTRKVIAEEDAKKRAMVNKLGDGLDKESYNSESFLDERSYKVDKALMTACERGNATALRTYYQLTNRLIEKSEQEVKIGLSADEITRRNLEADRQLREGGY